MPRCPRCPLRPSCPYPCCRCRLDGGGDRRCYQATGVVVELGGHLGEAEKPTALSVLLVGRRDPGLTGQLVADPGWRTVEHVLLAGVQQARPVTAGLHGVLRSLP